MTPTDPMHAEYQRQFQELRRSLASAHEEINRLITRVTGVERTTARLDGKPVPVPIFERLGDQAIDPLEMGGGV